MPNSLMRNSQFPMNGSATNPQQLAQAGGMNMNQMIGQIRNFKNLFHGDPKQKCMEMIQQGLRSNEQLNQAMAMAQQFKGMF